MPTALTRVVYLVAWKPNTVSEFPPSTDVHADQTLGEGMSWIVLCRNIHKTNKFIASLLWKGLSAT